MKRRQRVFAPFVVAIGRKRYGSAAMPKLEYGHLMLDDGRGSVMAIPVIGRTFTIICHQPQAAPSNQEVGAGIRRAFGLSTRQDEVEEFNKKRNRQLEGMW